MGIHWGGNRLGQMHGGKLLVSDADVLEFHVEASERIVGGGVVLGAVQVF